MNKIKAFKGKTKYIIKDGDVLGNSWGGGLVWYPIAYRNKIFNSDNDLKEFLDKELNSGGLDSGMGFESLKGYVVNYIIRKEIFFNGYSYKKDFYGVFIENISDDELNFYYENN